MKKEAVERKKENELVWAGDNISQDDILRLFSRIKREKSDIKKIELFSQIFWNICQSLEI